MTVVWFDSEKTISNLFQLKLTHYNAAAAAAKSLQSCPTLCDPIDGSPLGSPIPGILQARTLEWVAISFSNAWKWKVKVKSLSRTWLLATPWTAAYQAPRPGLSRQEYWSGMPPMNSMKRQKDTTLKDELPRSVGAQNATEDQWRNNPRKNEEIESKQQQNPFVEVTGDRSKVRCCKQQYWQEPGMLGLWIKANWKWSNRRCEHWHFRNQRTKMDWNGWLERRWPFYLQLWARSP